MENNKEKDKEINNTIKKRKLLPLPVLVAVDITLTGIFLCIFALFHHVIPSVQEADVSANEPVSEETHVIFSDGSDDTQENESSTSTSVTEDSQSNSDLTDVTETATSDAQAEDSLTEDTVSADAEASTSASQSASSSKNAVTPTSVPKSDSSSKSVATPTPTPKPTATPTLEPTQAPASDSSDSIFTDGDVISTDSSYKSSDVSITLTDYDVDGVVYHVEDIYIKNVENLRTAFADDSYGKGITDWPLSIAEDNNAIAAINGDYYGTTSDSGVVIRNGVLYRDNPDSDVLVMYYDGTMKVFSASEFDGDDAIADGAYQAWCFGPSLLDSSGNAYTRFSASGHIASENPRTFIGYYEAGHYCFVTVDGRTEESSGLTYAGEAKLAEKLGLTIAYNLDGGKTSSMTLNGEIVNVPADGGRECSDIIYIAELN